MKAHILIPMLLTTAIVGCVDNTPHEQINGLEDWQLGPEEWPITCENAAQDITTWLKPRDLKEIKSLSRDELVTLHHGLGMTIRNRQGLWRGNDKLIESCLGKPGHPDNASTIIIEKTWLLLQE